MSDGGKGSAPRKNQDHEAYSANWDRIFGKKQANSKKDRLEMHEQMDSVNAHLTKTKAQ